MSIKIIKKVMATMIVAATISKTPSLVFAGPPKKYLTQSQKNQSQNPGPNFSELCQIANFELDELLKKSLNTDSEKKEFAEAVKNFAKFRLLKQCPEDKLGELANMLGMCRDNVDAQKDVVEALSRLLIGKLLKANSKIEVKEIINILYDCLPNGALEDFLRSVCALTHLSYEIQSKDEIEKLTDILENCSQAENLRSEVARSIRLLITQKIVAQSYNHHAQQISDNCVAKIKIILDRCSTRESAKEDILHAKLELEHIKPSKSAK